MKSFKTILLSSVCFIFLINESYSRERLHNNQAILTNVSSSPTTQSLRADLYAVNTDGTTSLEDGTLELYNTSYCDCVNYLEDAKKMSNFLENLSIDRNGYLLSIEARQPVGLTDTVFYNMTQMQHKNYYLSFTAVNLNHPNLFGFLQDSYTGTSTPINLDGTTTVPFSVTADPGTSAPNRFQVVFNTISVLSGITGVVPVTYTSVTASRQNNNIDIEWQVDNQINVSKYLVEKSTDGVAFNEAATIAASGKSTSTYNWADINPVTGNNFYRVEEINTDGSTQYSKIVKVAEGGAGNTISVYPNPVVSGIIGLQMNNMPAGNYTIRLLNNFGQALFAKSIFHNEGSATESITIGQNINTGVYRLEVIHPDNTISNINVVF